MARERACLLLRFLRNLIQISFGLGQLRRERLCHRLQIVLARVGIAEQLADCRIADRERSRQRQNAITYIFLTATAQRLRSPHIAYIIATVIQHAEQMPKPP